MELEIIETTAVRIVGDNRERRVFPPLLSDAIKKRYHFVEYPKTMKEFVSGVGITYEYGYFEDFVIGKLVAYNDAVFITAQEHSDRLEKLADDFIKLVEEETGIELDTSLSRSIYLSKVGVSLKDGFSAWFSQLQPVIDRMAEAVRKTGIDVSSYDVGGFSIAGEGPSELKPGRFVLERRAGQPLNSNLFYSEAPLSTNEHEKLLAEIENLF